MSKSDISLDRALEIIKSELSPTVSSEKISLSEACGRIAAENISAQIAVPRHANAAVDGYGFRFADLPQKTEVSLSVIGTARAGHAYDGDIGQGEAIKIFTGAPVNTAAIDTIIMQEHVTVQGKQIAFPYDAVKQGGNLRKAGDDVEVGDALIRQGEIFNPAHIGLLAAQAVPQVSVFRKLKVGLLSGGDELRDDQDGTLADGTIYDSNRPMLRHLLELNNYEVNDCGIIKDNEADLLSVLRTSPCDVMLASGGMALGQEDHLHQILARHGRLVFQQIKCKPGRPAGFGFLEQDDDAVLPIIGLPGNPVAAFTVYSLLGRAALVRLSGGNYRAPLAFPVRLGEDFRKKPGRREFVRASLLGDEKNGGYLAVRCGKVGAGVLSSIAAADGFLDFAEADGDRKTGDSAGFIPMSQLLYL